jgi:hypothetical protein
MLRVYVGKCAFLWITYKFIRTSSEADDNLCMTYYRTGSRFSTHAVAVDLTVVVDMSRVQALLLLLWHYGR